MRVISNAGLLAVSTWLLAITTGPSSAMTRPALPPIIQHTPEQWYTSIDDYIAHLRGVHPEPFAKMGRLEWLRAADALKRELPHLSEEQRMVRLMQLNALVGDGHTSLEPDRADFGIWYPVHIVEFPDGYFVTSAYKDFSELAGAQVLEIAGRPVAEVASAERSLVGADNVFGARFLLGSLHNAALMRGLGYAAPDHSLSMKFRLADGQTVLRTLPAFPVDGPRYEKGFSRNDWEDSAETLGPPFGNVEDWITAFNGEPASAFRQRDERHPVHLTLRRGLVTRNLPDHKAYYIQSNIVEDNFDESFRRLFRRAMDEIDAAKPKHVIIDLRNNRGGDGSRVPELIPMFAKHLSREQNLYILTGPKTFSAAILWLGDFTTFLHPTIIGEPAGAALNSFGDNHEYRLAEIGVSTHISTLRNVKSSVNDLSRFTPVDVPAPMTFADWRAGRDPAIDPILAGKEMRSFAQIALTDGAAAARRSFTERQGAYAKYSWWSAPPEIEFRRAVQLLTEEGRYEDAIAIGEISIRFHPEIWNSWYNLAQTQLEARRLEEAQANMRVVLQVDPDNFNKDELADIARRSPDTEFTVPSLLQWGRPVAEVERLARSQCQRISTRPISPPFLASVQHSQQQIDCDGFHYQGAPRHLELIIRDGELVGAWLMMSAGDGPRVLEWMKRDLDGGGEDHTNYVVYGRHLVAWRKDKAELLFYSPQLTSEVSTWFGERAH